MKISKLNAGDVTDFVELIVIFKDVFENDSPGASEKYLSTLLSNPDFFVVVAKDDNEVIGGLTVFVLHVYYDEKPVAYIYDVGVKQSHQGKGVGKALMAFVTDYCQKNGFLEAYVEAETEDIDAVRFYRKTSFSNEMQATHFTYRL